MRVTELYYPFTKESLRLAWLHEEYLGKMSNVMIALSILRTVYAAIAP